MPNPNPNPNPNPIPNPNPKPIPNQNPKTIPSPNRNHNPNPNCGVDFWIFLFTRVTINNNKLVLLFIIEYSANNCFK